MRTRYGNEYTERDIEEQKASKAAMAAINDEEYAAMRAKAQLIVSGLVSKYGFSENGAKRTLALIEQLPNFMGEHPVFTARFATDEMKQAAIRAYDYYWK